MRNPPRSYYCDERKLHENYTRYRQHATASLTENRERSSHDRLTVDAWHACNVYVNVRSVRPYDVDGEGYKQENWGPIRSHLREFKASNIL